MVHMLNVLNKPIIKDCIRRHKIFLNQFPICTLNFQKLTEICLFVSLLKSPIAYDSIHIFRQRLSCRKQKLSASIDTQSSPLQIYN